MKMKLAVLGLLSLLCFTANSQNNTIYAPHKYYLIPLSFDQLKQYSTNKDSQIPKPVSIANAFPGNVNAKPDFVTSDALFADAFKIYQEGQPANEFVGLPVAEELMRLLNVEVQKMFDGQQTAQEAAAAAQEKWLAEF